MLEKKHHIYCIGEGRKYSIKVLRCSSTKMFNVLSLSFPPVFSLSHRHTHIFPIFMLVLLLK
uniref:Uncharacterized protein n=1 Tax=Anguilla anguilla TaxID=7936 RepID=A0A0E9RPY9_ANGAN